MPNQRAIAKEAQVSQATVSLALRGDPRVSPQTIIAVAEAAKRLGYTPNSYVSSLMAHIQKGRPVHDKGCIAILADASSESDWLFHHTYKRQQSEMIRRAVELGFRPEVFYLRGAGLNAKKIDRILKARGIRTLILAAPYRQTSIANFDWNHYAMVTGGFSWNFPQVDRVVSNYLAHVNEAYLRLRQAGYERIGMCLQDVAAGSVSSSWLAGYYVNHHHTPKSKQIPLAIWGTEHPPLPMLKTWYQKWKPDAVICEHIHEYNFFVGLGYSMPKDFAYACLNRPPDSDFSGMEEKNDRIGRTLIDLVVAQTLRNEHGIPDEPKTVQIKGEWVTGKTSASPARAV